MRASRARSKESPAPRSGAGHASRPEPFPRVTVLLTETEIAEGLVAALSRHELPERYSYWFPTSVRAWLDLCSDGAYRNYVRSSRLVSEHAAEVAALASSRCAPSSALDVVSLGAGQADKDIEVLRALRARGHAPIYRPVDASQALLELACAAARDQPCEAVKADVSLPGHLDAIDAMRAARPALWMLLGNTLGAFDPRGLCSELRRVVRRGDTLLIDAEILDRATTIAGYDNPLNRRFAFAPLAALGLEPADGELRFTLVDDEGCPGFFKLVKRFESARNRRLSVAGEAFELHAGEALHMGHSGKFSADGFRAILSGAGFGGLAAWSADDGRFVMSVVA
jgi:uncharacterized SAM-dependent methyltransferase